MERYKKQNFDYKVNMKKQEKKVVHYMNNFKHKKMKRETNYEKERNIVPKNFRKENKKKSAIEISRKKKEREIFEVWKLECPPKTNKENF